MVAAQKMTDTATTDGVGDKVVYFRIKKKINKYR